MNQYIYKLGHCPDLGVAEFKSITDTEDCKFNFQWLISNTNLDVNQTGSLVFGAQVISTFQDGDQDQVLDYLDQYLSKNMESKKLGLFLHGQDSKKVFSVAKKHFNKVTVVDKIPNFGYWKQTNNWLVLIKFQSVWYFAKILSYADQEFWTELDHGLPFADMNRGIINLKLGRSLLNLTKSQIVWDNFAGQGRVLLSGMDIKTTFLASDKDESVMTHLNQNLTFANKFWKTQKYNKIETQQLAQIQQTFVHDATEGLDFDLEYDTSIVTEGYLGKNYRETTQELAEEQVQIVSAMWQKLLVTISKSQVKDIIGCLPYYPQLSFVPEYEFLFDNLSWKVEKLSKNNFIKYQRENSKVGHLIFKLSKLD